MLALMRGVQGPLLMQSVLSPIVGRLSDVLDRKYLAAIPPLIAFVGAIISAKATSMSMLIGGGILIGTTLSTIAIVQAIPSEILPLKYRALANGFSFMGGAIGGLFVPLLESLYLAQASDIYVVLVVSAPEPSPTSMWRVGAISFGSKPHSTVRRLWDCSCSTGRPRTASTPR